MEEPAVTSAATDGHRTSSRAGSLRGSRERFDRLFDEAIARLWPAIAALAADRRSAEAEAEAMLRELFAALPENAPADALAAHCDALLRRRLRRPAASERPEDPLSAPRA